MKVSIKLFLTLAISVASTWGYGFKYSKNPYSGECKLQLNLPGLGQKEAFPGIMNTRYGSNDGKYHHHGGSGHHGSQGSAGLGHHSGGSSGHYGSSSSNRHQSPNHSDGNYGVGTSQSNNYASSSGGSGGNKYGGGSGRFPSNTGSNYGSSSSSSNYGSSGNSGGSGSSENFGSSTNNYGSSGKYAPSGSYGGSSGNYGSSGSSGSYGGSSGNYGGASGGSYESSSGNHGTGHYGGSDRDRHTTSSNYDRDTGNYNSGSGHRGSSSHASSSSSNYGSSNGGNYGPSGSGGNYGSSSSSNFGSSDNRGSSDRFRPSENRDHNRFSSSSQSNRGSSGGGGGSSSENFGHGGGTTKLTTRDYDYYDRDFASEVLSTHNSYRAIHSTPPVTLDEKMSELAQDWANQLASGRSIGHSPEATDGVYGESIKVLAVPTSGTNLVERLYDERANYDFGNPNLVKKPPSRSNSHFTAVIWYGTRKLGVGKATASDGRSFVVVNYWPPGNIVDVLEANVIPPRTDLGPPREIF